MSQKRNLENSESETTSFLDNQLRELNGDETPELMPTKQGRDPDDEEDGETPESSEPNEDQVTDDEAMERAKAKAKSAPQKKAKQDEQEEVDDDQEEVEEGQEEEEEAPPAKHLPKSEVKIIKQRDTIKSLESENARLRTELQKREESEKTESLTEKYKAQGYDDDVAASMAQKDVRLDRIEARQAILDFKEQNEELLQRYPQARVNVAEIMQKAAAAQMTPEQVCIALYGAESQSDRRAKDSVRNPAKAKPSDYSVANANRSGQKTVLGTSYSTSDIENKSRLDSMRVEMGLKPLTTEEWLERKKKYNL